ncbi:MAG: XrtA/PEP-CTERM system TPR-repeat protein PrsT, partial [Gammaproteobacteria bacterium]
AATLALGAVAAAAQQEDLSEISAAVEKGDLRTAVIKLKSVLQENPENGEARLLLGRVYLRVGNGAGAEKEIRRARSAGVPMDRWGIDMGRAYLAQGQADKVILELEPDYSVSDLVKAELIALKGTAYLTKGAMDDAKKQFELALKTHPDSGEAYLGLSRLAVLSNDLETGEKHVRRALAKDSSRAASWVVQAEIFRRNKKFVEAAKAFDRALNVEAGNMSALIGRATTYVAMNKPEIAERDVDLVLKYRPNDPQARFLKASILFARKEIEPASEQLVEVLRLQPNHPAANMLMGAIEYERENLELAEEHLKRYVRVIKTNPRAIKLLAAIRMKTKRPREAVEILETIHNAEMEQDPQYLALLGSAYLQSNDPEQGNKYLAMATDLQPDAAAMHSQLAMGQLVSGEYDAAVKSLKESTRLEEGMGMSDVMLVFAQMRNKDTVAAIKTAKDLIKANPDSAVPWNLLGAAHLNQGEYDRASEAFKKALEIDPKMVSARLNLAQIDLVNNDIEAAQVWYREVEKLDSKNQHALLAMSSYAAFKGKLDEAISWAEKARNADPQAEPPLIALTGLYLRSGDSDRAISTARQNQVAHPESEKALNTLAAALAASGRLEEAEGYYRDLVKLNPISIQPRLQLATILVNRKDLEGAVSQLNKAIDLDPKALAAPIMKADLLYRMGNLKEAIATAEKVIELDPKVSAGYELSGEMYMRLDRYQDAYDRFNQAYKVGKSAALAIKRHQAAKALKYGSASLKPLQEWLNDYPDDDKIQMIYAVAQHELGLLDEAKASYEKVLKTQPDNLVVYNNLAWMLLDSGDPKGLAYAKKAYEKAPNRAEVVDTYGWALVQMGDKDEGVRALEKAVNMSPKRPDMRYHLGVGLNALGRYKDARIHLERALQLEEDFPERKKTEALLASLPK